MRLTTAKYFTPKGRSIQAEGITPDILVDNNIVKGKERVIPLREKDLIDTEKNMKRLEGLDNKNIEGEDFQLYMGLQILKSWEALRGK